MKKLLSMSIAFAVLIGVLLGNFLLMAPAIAADLEQGAQVFSIHCAGCHVNGGNIVRRGKNLKLKTLERNGLDSVEAIAQLVTNGKGIMSAYGDRLTGVEIQNVSAYVLEQAKQGW
ncbi:cytochrome C6 [filamentous cyanobacterium CCP1]|nr:cytochrome C6 [filamentous cyanobacterium CCP2]PSB68068.1 cytochrome C6 [filamentous cyanobacterium CCP1]